ncbi:type IV pilus modification protein PilV [Acidihalobacter prosperus]|uniref:Type IV fimbrial biogenesis protein PilV n=1 Tax=Acidihalobacter prosperus TaxID=160660 RepID=A0A1A6C4Q1_9GAMM|nr:type IV pilus modification protein PilV [Acidihalobacter prosperus]OBS09546.1 Type IV fimbrial biogenesis protein PilV [Acidihalobacter prosperus]
MKPRTTQNGFSLIEALVALLVITIGLLGVAGLQALAVNNTHSASLRSIAAMEASNMAAYMAANASYWAYVAPAGLTVTPIGASATFTGAGASVLASAMPSSCTGTSSNCSAKGMAAWDLRNWGIGLGRQLPAAQGHVACYTAVNDPMTCVISVQWREKTLALNAPGASGTAVAPAPSTTMQTYSLVTQP